jgi:hypothetical protein
MFPPWKADRPPRPENFGEIMRIQRKLIPSLYRSAAGGEHYSENKKAIEKNDNRRSNPGNSEAERG